jgi:regulation of enolase protein 1 (concanavalin A-like superfamily)
MARSVGIVLLLFFVLLLPTPAHAQYPVQERLCDVAFENCRTQILDLINAETQEIDVAFWFMEDARYSNALINRFRAGVKVRVLFDSEALPAVPVRKQIIDDLKNAGIPIRDKTSGGILHWKLMIFGGQNIINMSAANFSPTGYVPTTPYTNYEDEVVFFATQPSLVDSFKTKYDDVWTATSGYTNYANITPPLLRSYPTSPIDSRLNFPPTQDYGARAVARYDAETVGIDVDMYRITDRRHSDAMIRAVQRGVPVRLYTEQEQYRDSTRLWHAWNVDRMYMAGVQIRHRQHDGLNHQKSVILRGQQMVIYGSSNWTSPSATSQLEHNLFETEPWFYNFFVDNFERKWNNTGPAQETEPFVPLPPDPPVYVSPANTAQGQPQTITLKWNAGFWAHKYDIYFGTTPTPPLVAADVELGPSETPTDYITYSVPGTLASGTTYYWKVVSKTMANRTANGPTWSFRTTGAAPGAGPGDVVLYASTAVRNGNWQVVADSGAAGGNRIWNPDAGLGKVGTPSASPADYFELSFHADAGVGYRLWMRGEAQSNSYPNDSVFVQFSDSVDSGGTATWRSGTTSATTVSIEDCSGCGLQNWGWNDNEYGGVTLGPLVYFAATGTHTIRVQRREDGISLDQIILSRSMFLNSAPGATKNDATIYAESDGTGGGNPPPPPPPGLPSGWTGVDIGSVSAPGSSNYDSATHTFTVQGSGADIWGTADAFQYAYTTLSGDGEIVARVASVQNVDSWTKAGVMMRASLSAGSPHATMFVSSAKGTAFQRRVTANGVSTNTAGAATTAPYWVKVTRIGNTLKAYTSANGSTWTQVGTDSIPLGTIVDVGLAVTSHHNGTLATATFDNVTITPYATELSTLPEGWSSQDIGSTSPAGGSAYDSGSGVFTIQGAGADIWGTADAFQFAWMTLTGDGEIVARVASVQNVDQWTKAGVMIRNTTSAGSAQASMFVSSAKGTAFQRRASAGAASTSTAGPVAVAPYWVKMTRIGTSLTAYASSNGTAWTQVGTETIAMGSNVDVGLAVTSHHNGALARATFDSVTVTAY